MNGPVASDLNLLLPSRRIQSVELVVHDEAELPDVGNGVVAGPGDCAERVSSGEEVSEIASWENADSRRPAMARPSTQDPMMIARAHRCEGSGCSSHGL